MEPLGTWRESPTLRRLLLTCLVLGVAFGAIARWLQATDHFGHVDDLGVAVTLLGPNRGTYLTWAQARERAEIWSAKRNHPIDGTSDAKSMNLIAAAILVKGTYEAISPISTIWTYAPAQFVLTELLLAFRSDYASVKFLGRFPSLLLGLLAVALTYLACSPVKSLAPSPANVVPALLASLSWQQIVYSAQMENYAAATCGGMALAYLLGRLHDTPPQPLRSRILVGVFLGGLTALQYQLAILIPGFLVALGVSMKGRFPSWRATFSALAPTVIAAGLVFAVITLPYFFKVRNVSLNWNTGPAREFLFQWRQNNLPGALGHAVRFFSENAVLVMESMFSPVGPDSFWLPFLTVAVCAIVLAGAGALIAGTSPAIRPFRYFIGIGLVLWFMLVAIGRLPLSPTRHQMALVPILLLIAGAGSAGIHAWMSRKTAKGAAGIIVCFCATWIVAFSLEYRSEAAAREDKFSEERILRLVQQFDVSDVVQHTWTVNLSLMPGLREKLSMWTIDYTEGFCEGGRMYGAPGHPETGSSSRGRVMFVSHRARFPVEAIPCVAERLPAGGAMTPGIKPERVYDLVETSATEVDWSRRTKNGTNGFFVEIYDFRRNDAGTQKARGDEIQSVSARS